MKTKKLQTTFNLTGKDGKYHFYGIEYGYPYEIVNGKPARPKTYYLNVQTPYKVWDLSFEAKNLKELKKKCRDWLQEYELYD